VPNPSPIDHRPVAENPTSVPFVSVVVPVYNDAARLEACLHALEAQGYPRERFEIIVVDNQSTDHSARVAAGHPRVRLAHEAAPGSYAARNRGLALADGEIVAFTDSDCVPDPTWLENGVACLRGIGHCGLVGGAIRFTFASPGHPTPAELYDSIFDLDQARFLLRAKFACTANLLTYAAVIRDVGPFNAQMKSVGDREWGNRVAAAGYAQAFAADAVVSHPARRTLRALLDKRLRVAGGHRDRARGRSWSGLRFMVAVVRQVVRNPIWGAARIWRGAPDTSFSLKLRILGLYAFLCYADAAERIRLQLGGSGRR
jgi:glycosyltransferase involved in cell wall biosynthesis